MLKKCFGCLAIMLFFIVGFRSTAGAVEVTDKVSVEGDLAGAYQYQSVSDADPYDSAGRGAVTFQPVLRLQLTERDAASVKFGFGAGNGLNDGTTPFYLNPWATDLEGDVKEINSRDRDYLLTAWYGHAFGLGAGGVLDLVGGIIDATEYLDDNAYANDGLTQFMNAALVNGPNVFLPSYDMGGAARWEMNDWSAKAVIMNVGENDDGNNYTYFGVQGGYKLKLNLGEGNYRVNINRTTDDFNGPNGKSNKPKTGFMTSCDQALGDTFGVWVRIGFQDDDAYIDYKNLYSGGLNINGKPWSRQEDNIGIGLAFLDGGNGLIDESKVFEVYYRCVLSDYAALTVDFQYIEEKFNSPTIPDNPKGLISGLRFVASF